MKIHPSLSCLALAAGLLAAASGPCFAQTEGAAPSSTPAPATAPAGATTSPSTVHHVRRRGRHHSHVVHHRRPPPQQPDTGTASQAPTPPAYSSAPTPDGNLLPPHEYIPPATSVVPGALQLHYPPSGNGYVTGSSPQALDDDRTAKVPGLTLHVPLQPDPKPAMPPPDDPLH